MKQKIGNMQSPDQPITDIDVVFTAMYNLIYEKLEQEPDKGIVVCKGQPNQRKVKWKEVMSIAHMLEDFFAMREQRTGCKICEECAYWKSISVASPHIGECTKYGKRYLHKFNSCKKGFKLKEGEK